MTSPSKSAKAGPAAVGVCPICQSASVQAYHPFCSKRCSEVDLHRWLNESYAIPAVEDDSEGTGEDEGWS